MGITILELEKQSDNDLRLNKNYNERGCQLTGRVWNRFSFEVDASFRSL